MTTATARFNGHAPSAACIEAARALLGTALKGDRDAAIELARIPSAAWPDTLYRTVADKIIELTQDGAALELPILLHRLAVGAEVSTGAVSELATVSPVYDVSGVGNIIRSDYRERESRHLADLHRRGGITAVDLQARLAALDSPDTGGAAVSRVAVDLAGWRNAAPAPVPLLFSPVIPRRCVVGNSGAPGLMKSAFAHTLGMSLATGRCLFPSFQPERAGNVMLIDFEDGGHERHRRTYRYAAGYEFTGDDWDRLESNFHLYCLQTEAIVDQRGAPTPFCAWLADEIRAKEIDLCIVDTFVHTGVGDENDNQAQSARMTTFKRLAELRDEGTTIYLVHHTAKARDNEQSTAAARGAGVFRDICRTLLTTTALTADEVKQYGISNARRFARVDSVKTSWTPPLEKALIFENHEGIWFETDMAQRMAETERATKETTLKVVAEVLGTNDANLSLNEIGESTKPEATEFRKAVKDRIGSRLPNQAIRDAVEHGLTTGYLDEKPSDKPGRKSIIPAYFGIRNNSEKTPFGIGNS